MIDSFKWLTLPIMVLSAFSAHAGEMMEQEVPDPQAAITYWTKESMRAAIPMVLPDPHFDGIQEFLATTEFTANLRGALTKDEEAEEEFEEERESRREYKEDEEDERNERRPRRWRGTIRDICDGEAGCTTFLPEDLRDDNPHMAIGKLFFELWGFNFVCSAASVTSRGPEGRGNRRTVLTAGHCCNDGAGTFASSSVFVPAYDRGEAPYGIWPAQTLAVTQEWNSGFGLALARDVCVIRSAPGTGEFEDEDLHDVVGALGIKFNRKRLLGTKYALNGYPVLNWGGEQPVITLGRASVLDSNFTPNPVGTPSQSTGGSSGGPWLLRYRPDFEDDERWEGSKKKRKRRANIINGINSYVYGGVDIVYSPYFDGKIYDLLQFVARQP